MSFRDLLFKNLWLKMFSLLLATLIWFTVRANLGSLQVEVSREFANLPVRVMTEAGQRGAFQLGPNIAIVTVRGPASAVQLLKEADVYAFVRVPGQPERAAPLPIEVHVPPNNIVVTHVNPQFVLLKAAAPP